jgi:voltage-gated potassium channel Kch
LAFVSLLAYDAYTKLFSQEILDWIIKRQRSHTLICGSGRIGTVLAKNLLQDKSKVNKVTVIEKDPNSPALDELRELGANVMIADATLLRNLKRARCYLANEIFVVTGSDEANLDIVADVISTLDRTKKDAPIPKIYVHLNQMRLERIISEKIEKDDARLRKQILYFNPLEESLRDLFDDEVLSRRPNKPEEVAHYVIVGFGHTGQQLALFLAENAHFENLKRSRMTIVYRSEEQASVNRFKDLYPRFFPKAQWVFCLPSEYNYADALWDVDPSKDHWTYGVDLKKKDGIDEIDYEQSKGVGFAVNGSFVRMDGGCTSPSFIENLYKLCKQPNVRPMVFICNADDEENCAEAIELRQVMDDRLKPKAKADNPYPDYVNQDHEVSIIAYVPDHPSLLRLLNKNKGIRVADRVAWGNCEESCKHIRLETDIIKKLADKIAQAYGTEDKDLPFLSAWELSSNRKAAIHLNAKLAVINWRIISPAKKKGAIEITEDQFSKEIAEAIDIIDSAQSDPSSKNDLTMKMIIMAKMEHHRWLAERVLQDWSLGLKSEEKVESRKLETRKRPSFVDWDKTLNKDKTYNVKQIKKAFEFLYEMLKEPQEKPTESVKEDTKLFSIHRREH